MAVDEGDVGGLAVGELDGEAQTEAGAGHAQLVFADFVEEAGAVAQDDGDARYRVPDHIAKPAQAGEGDADAVPVGVEGHVVRGADRQQALSGGGDGAGVGEVELKAAAGRQGLGERDGGLVQLAGVVGVGVERGYLERHVVGVETDALPVERGGDLERDAAERRLAVVADRDQGADGDLLGRRAQAHVHVEAGEGDGLAVGVLGRGRGGHLDRGRSGLLAGVRGNLAILVHGAGEDDLAFGLRVPSGGRGLRGAGENGKCGEGETGDSELHEPRPFCFFGLTPAVWPAME